MQRSLLNAINDFITEAGDTFHKDGYIAANLERLIEIPDPIDRFEELTGTERGCKIKQFVNIVFGFEFCIMELKRKRALLGSNSPGINSCRRKNRIILSVRIQDFFI